MKRILNNGFKLFNSNMRSKFYQNMSGMGILKLNPLFNYNNKYFSNNSKNSPPNKDENDSDSESNNKENEKEIKIIKLTPEEEQSLDDFTGETNSGLSNNLGNNNNPSSNSTESNSANNPQSKEKIENYPLIHYSNPILPYSKITINNPSKNDILFNMLIKYGKLTPIDEETTIIEDITLFFEKDDPFAFNLKSMPKKELSPHILGVLCKITYLNKEKLVIEGLNKIYKVKSLRSGKLKFFNPKETNTVDTHMDSDNPEYVTDCFKLFENITNTHEYIVQALKLDPDYFNDGNKTSFNFNIAEIKEKLSEIMENKPIDSDVESTLKQLIQYSFYFILKANTFSNIIYQGSNISNEVFKMLYISDLKLKLEKILESFENIQKFINVKYEFYNFPKPQDLQFQTENPFNHDTEVEMNRINKYKDVIENKISEVDSIEKQKEDFRRKIMEIKSMSEEVKKSIEKEINKISSVHLDQENGKRIEYLNHIMNLPWDNVDEPEWNLEHAKQVLDGGLYGLNETKERIYEFIAKNMRKNNKKGCVILLTGGPGTGKTRIAKLIGEALKRKVGFVSLAGVSDGKSILGFKRTYVSSTPGMFIREMQHVGVKNPVIVVDEIDKVGFRYSHSNVYHALLQLLNPEENHRFQDHYLEVPFDFSNVVFILTSNNDEIFPPLIDRMEIIKVDPYVNYEKFFILKNYAKDQILKEYNFQEYGNKFQITDKAIYKLIFEYCKREAGVRKAKKLLESVVRKVNSKIELGLKVAGCENNQGLPLPLQINSKNILKILNEPTEEDPVLIDMIINGSKRVGCCMGLFVSKTDQSNSWGSASIFSLSVKEIKEVKDRTDNVKTIKDSFDGKGDLKVNKVIGKDIRQDISEEDQTDVTEENSHSNSKKKTGNSDHPTSKHSSSDSKKKPKKSQFKISSSGSLGEDSLQSVDIALNYATEFLGEIYPENADFFYKHQLHHDCPEILLPKSGPSAGIVIFLCAISLAMNKPIIPHLAMTGEICIDGSVLKIGGVKEKSQGAQQFGVKTLVIPIGNKYDFMDLPANLKDSFERVFFVENCRQVYNIGFNLDTSDIDCYIPDKCLSDIHDIIEDEALLQKNLADQLFK